MISRSSVSTHLARSVEGREHVLHSLLSSLQQPRTHNVIPRLSRYFTFVVNIRMVLNWVCNGGVHFVRFILSEIALVVFFMNNPRKYAQVFFKGKNHLIFTCEVIFNVQLFSVNNQRKMLISSQRKQFVSSRIRVVNHSHAFSPCARRYLSQMRRVQFSCTKGQLNSRIGTIFFSLSFCFEVLRTNEKTYHSAVLLSYVYYRRKNVA